MTAFEYLENILFGLSAFTVVYYLFYSLMGGMFKRSDRYGESRKKHRIAILIPAYKDDAYILPAVESFLKQDYPIDCFDITVISDQLSDETNTTLAELPIRLLKVDFEGKSSKMKSVKAGVKNLLEGMYDLVLVMNADNTVEPDFLNLINNTYSSGSNAIQGHRIRLERSNDSSMLNAIADEINNCIYRAGHVNIGLSATLNGSGMAFDCSWLKGIIDELGDYDDEKTIEALLLQERIYVEYLDKAHVYANRKEGRKKFYTQRKNGIKNQYASLFSNILRLPGALLSGNFDYADRILNWIAFPKTILLGVIVGMGILSSCMDWMEGLKWWGLILVLLLSMAFAIPDYLVDQRFNKAVRSIPGMGIGMLLNVFGFHKK